MATLGDYDFFKKLERDEAKAPEGWEVTTTGIIVAPTEKPEEPAFRNTSHTHTAHSLTPNPGSTYYHTYNTSTTTAPVSFASGSAITYPQSGVASGLTAGTYYAPQTYSPPPVNDPVYEHPVVPLFADAVTVRAALQRQVIVLESLQDGVSGEHAEHLADALFFLHETMEALEKI